MTDIPNPTTLHMPKPSNAYAPIKIYIDKEIKVFTGGGHFYPRSDTLKRGQQITTYEPKHIAGDGTKWLYLEYTVDGLPKGGWINGASLSFRTTPPTVEMPVVRVEGVTKPLNDAPKSTSEVAQVPAAPAPALPTKQIWTPGEIASLEKWKARTEKRLALINKILQVAKEGVTA